jgi:hypothetical protein
MYYGRFSQDKRRWLIERPSPSDLLQAANIEPKDKIEELSPPKGKEVTFKRTRKRDGLARAKRL